MRSVGARSCVLNVPAAEEIGCGTSQLTTWEASKLTLKGSTRTCSHSEWSAAGRTRWQHQLQAAMPAHYPLGRASGPKARNWERLVNCRKA